MSAELRPALFLDRDGVLNVDRSYVSRAEDFEWVLGAKDCVRHFNDLGYWVFVVTNQSGIAQGFYSEDDMHAVHAHMIRELKEAGAHVDRIYFCPYHPEAEIEAYRKDSDERKPGPGMLLRAMQDFSVDRQRSFLIGDKPADIEAAKAAGIPGFLFSGGNLCSFAMETLAQVRTDVS